MAAEPTDMVNHPPHYQSENGIECIDAIQAALSPEDPLEVQIGGDHYKALAIEPVEYIHANGIGFCEGSAIKYLTRWKSKNGVQDLEKAKHFIDILIQLESKCPGN